MAATRRKYGKSKEHGASLMCPFKGDRATPRAARPTPGALDICFLTRTPIDKVIGYLNAHGVEIEDGPVKRTGTDGPLLSIYVRDPDSNLIEISNRIRGAIPSAVKPRSSRAAPPCR